MVKHPKSRPFKIRPDDATASQALRWRAAGLTWDEIGKLWNGVCGQAVINVVKAAQKKEAKLKEAGG